MYNFVISDTFILMVDFSSKLCIEQTILTVEQELRRIINSRLSQFCFFLHLRLALTRRQSSSRNARGGAAGAEGDGKGNREEDDVSLSRFPPSHHTPRTTKEK